MFFVALLAALLYLYRLFRKSGARVASPYVDGPSRALPALSPDANHEGAVLDRLDALDDDNVALWDASEQKISSAELHADASCVAHRLAKLDLPRGSIVVLQEPYSLREWVAFELGVMRVGLVAALNGAGKQMSASSLLEPLETTSGRLTLPASPGPHEPALRTFEGRLVSHKELFGLLPNTGRRDSAVIRSLPLSSNAPRLAALAVLCGGGVVVKEVVGQSPVACDASLFGVSQASICADALRSVPSGWFQRWAASVANTPPPSSWIKRALHACQLIVADVLFFPRLLSPVLGRRYSKLLFDEPLSSKDHLLLSGYGLSLHCTNLTPTGEAQKLKKID